MKSLMIFTFVSILIASTAVWAQNPVPDPDTISHPIQEGDPALRTLPPRMDYVKDRKPITAEELPDPVRQTLESDARYSDWKEASIFRAENSEEYVVEFEEGEKTRTYRFNKHGTLILEE